MGQARRSPSREREDGSRGPLNSNSSQFQLRENSKKVRRCEATEGEGGISVSVQNQEKNLRGLNGINDKCL